MTDHTDQFQDPRQPLDEPRREPLLPSVPPTYVEPPQHPHAAQVMPPATPPYQAPFTGAQRPAPGPYSPPPAAPPAPARPAPLGEQPLPICDYTIEGDEPCEEPATVRRWSGGAIIVAAALGAIVGGVLVAAGIVWALGLVSSTPSLRTASPATTLGAGMTITPSSGSVDVAEAVAAKAVPSVVNVTIQQAVIDPLTGKVSYSDLGNGSGVIVRSDGYILTNNHVIEGADRVLVGVGVQNKVAKVVGADTSTDIAVLKIAGTGYSAIDIGSSKSLKVGQWVLAVGSPFGLEKTVTSGIVSALQRSEQVQAGPNDLTTYTNLIQTDAAINPGNSGGALVDEQGRIVGLNTLIQSPSGGVGAAQSAGIGFAIPVDFAMSIANQLISTGKASHPYLGVSTQTIDQSVAAQFGLPVQSGALVAFVQPNGPGAAAGIQRGDIIIKIGTTDITSVEDMFAAVRLHKIGDTVPVTIVRGTATKIVSITLGSDAAGG